MKINVQTLSRKMIASRPTTVYAIIIATQVVGGWGRPSSINPFAEERRSPLLPAAECAELAQYLRVYIRLTGTETEGSATHPCFLLSGYVSRNDGGDQTE
jgi:hypothetical protein